MKHLNLLSLIVLSILLGGVLHAQIYQLPNRGFEQWDGTALDAEPAHWNSFATSDGSYASMASGTHHAHRLGSRPGGSGSHFLTIWTKSIIGVKANGNMTTGRIHAGAMSASSASNYNYTQRSNPDHSCPFTGTPDSMYVWVSFYAASASSEASVVAYIHGDNDFQDPNDWGDNSKYCGYAKARFTRTASSGGSYVWQQIKVPFVYDGTAAPHYILVSIATNKTPGSGAAYDSLSVDDIEFVYSSWLESISIDGQPLAGFSPDCMQYLLPARDAMEFHGIDVQAMPQVSDARIDIDSSFSNDTMRYSLLVSAEDGVSTHTYSILVPITPAAPPDTISYTLTLLSNNSDFGTLFGAGTYAEGSEVSFSAIPRSGCHFVSWNDGVGDNPRTITLLSDTTFSATFEQDAQEGIASPALSVLQVYPNPASGLVEATGLDRQPLYLLSAAGVVLQTIEHPAPTTHLNLAPFPAGTYFLRQGGRMVKVVRQ